MLKAPISAHSGFYPYDDNGGSVVAVAGKDFVLIASDSRLSTGFNIYTREQSKLFRLSNRSILGSSGCWCDTKTLAKILEARMMIYQHEHNKEMSTTALAQMLSMIMYQRRFFPYYVSNILAGLDAQNEGWVYSYDPIGSMEKSKFRAGGSSGALLQPLLDNQVGLLNMQNVEMEDISLDKALTIVQDVFISAAERDIYTGDSICVNIIKPDGITEHKVDLRKD